MKKSISLTLLMAASALAGCSQGSDSATKNEASGPTIAAPAGMEWTATVSKTPEGGFVMGNPAAAVKLIEYGAFSCSHCADFSETSKEGLKALVNKGNLSYEFRNVMNNVIDVPAALAVRCAGAQPFFQISEQLFADQRNWLGRTSSITPAEQQALSTMKPLEAAAMLAQKLELDKFVQQRGVSSEKLKACFADEKALDELGKMSQVSQTEYKITGTPTFILNGQVVKDANTWDKLEPMLKAAGA